MKALTCLVAVILSTVVAATIVNAQTSDPIRVTYVSIEAIYVNVGKKAGLAVGDTLRITRGDRAGVELVVTNLSSHSAACKKIDATTHVAIGDVLAMVNPVKRTQQDVAAGATDPARLEAVTRRVNRSQRERLADKNRMRGYLALQGRWQRDLGGAGVSWYQPSLSARFVIEEFAGKNMSLRVRHLSRFSHRDYSLSGSIDQSEWTHRLSEFAIVYGKPGSPVEVGAGRVVSSYVRGIGYIDGAYFAVRTGPRFRVGAAMGVEPNPVNSSFSSESRKIGVFVTHQAGSYERHRLATTFAVSAAYASDAVSREFVYLQNDYAFARRLKIYQSVEIDINRQWRKSMSGDRVSFSNFYLTANAFLNERIAVDASIDARKNIRDYNTMNTPDSLFDAGLRRGYDGGVTLRLPHRIRVRGRAGVRHADDENRNTSFASLFVTVQHFLRRGHHVTARLSRSQTRFTEVLGPQVTYRMPFMRRIRVRLMGGGYLYDTQGFVDNNYYGEIGADRTLGRRYHIAGSWRQYFGGALQSVELNAEIGVNF